MILRELTTEDRSEAVAAHEELALDHFDFLLGFNDKYDQDGGWPAYLEHLDSLRSGVKVPEGWVPSTFLVAEADGQMIGRVSIRHELNAYLEERGGHIGYGVRPQFRGRGYATEILAMALEIVRGLGVQRVLVTCDDSNTASSAVIEKCGGVLENIIEIDDGQPLRRYWIAPPQ